MEHTAPSWSRTAVFAIESLSFRERVSMPNSINSTWVSRNFLPYFAGRLCHRQAQAANQMWPAPPARNSTTTKAKKSFGQQTIHEASDDEDGDWNAYGTDTFSGAHDLSSTTDHAFTNGGFQKTADLRKSGPKKPCKYYAKVGPYDLEHEIPCHFTSLCCKGMARA